MQVGSRSSFLLRFAVIVIAGLAFSGCSSGNETNTGGGSNPVPRSFQFGELQGTSSVDPSGFLQRSDNGTNTTALLGGFTSLALQHPTRAPLTAKVVFGRQKINNNDIYSVNPDGTGEAQITPSDTRYKANPNLSADASKIVYTLGNDLYTMKADGSNNQLLVVNGNSPKWSPDGSKVAFSRFTDTGSHLFVIKADGTELTQVTASGPSNIEPNWFPNGQKLVFISNRNSAGNVYSINVDGSDETRLTTNAFEEHYPAVSPNGTKIALYRFSSGGVSGTYHMKADGTEITLVLGGASQPAWALDGNSLLTTYRQGGASGIFSIQLDGTIISRLTSTDGTDSSPSVGAPRPSNASLVGASGTMGAAATGFLYGSSGGSDSRVNGTPRSILTFASSASSDQFTTALPPLAGPTSVRAVQNPVGGITYIIESKLESVTLEALQFWNFSQALPTTVNSIAPMHGVVVTFDTITGEIATVAPYALGIPMTAKVQGDTRAQGTILKGRFLGIWNGRGQNLAPSGASEFAVDAVGRAITIR